MRLDQQGRKLQIADNHRAESCVHFLGQFREQIAIGRTESRVIVLLSEHTLSEPPFGTSCPNWPSVLSSKQHGLTNPRVCRVDISSRQQSRG